MSDTLSTTPSASAMLEIRISCPPILAAYLQELLWTLPGTESVGETYRADMPDDETHLSDLETVTFLTRNPLGEDLFKVLMVENAKLMKVTDIVSSRWIEEKDWAESWKQYWHPTPITDTLTIRPSWEDYTPKRPDERVITLDPGCAFGTGAHETTRLMLLLLDDVAKEKDFSQLAVLDVGTGSGILAIDAAMRGSLDVRGIDVDPLAVTASQENAALNNVADRITFSDTPIEDLCQTQVDLMLANIIAPVILKLLPEMLLRLAPGGTLLASGLIDTTVGQVEEALKAEGFSDIHRKQQGDWFALRATRA